MKKRQIAEAEKARKEAEKQAKMDEDAEELRKTAAEKKIKSRCSRGKGKIEESSLNRGIKETRRA